MKLNILRFLFVLTPVSAAAYYLWFICPGDGYIVQTLVGCVANSVVAVFLFWGLTGVVAAAAKRFWKKDQDLLGRIFFNLPFSVILIVLAFLLRGIFSLTCGCVTA